MRSEDNKRRDFLKKTVALGAAALAPKLFDAAPANKNFATGDVDGFTFLFQGDSITDGNRTRDNDWNHVMGHGYAYIIAGRLWYDFSAKKFHFYNRGVSGNKITDLAARWQNDTLDIKPNVLSILIGINDITTFIFNDKYFTAEQFEKDYRTLLLQTQQHLPGVQFVLCEPFILPVGKVKDNWTVYSDKIKKRQDVVKQLSTEFNAIFIPLQDAFNKALLKAPADYWIWDGIHPMPGGHELIAREWIKEVGKKLKFIR